VLIFVEVVRFFLSCLLAWLKCPLFFVQFFKDFVWTFSDEWCLRACQEFESEALRKKQFVESLIESSSDDRHAELMQLTDEWEKVRKLEIERSHKLNNALLIVSHTHTCIMVVFVWKILVSLAGTINS